MPFLTVSGNATAQTGDAGRDTLLEFDRESLVGGFAILAGAIEQIRSQKGVDNVLLLDAGDTFADDQLANITKGEAIVKLMNMVRYDLMTLGNHDFDYGLERTRELDKMATFPMRAANIIDEKTGQPVFGEPFLILEKNGTKIAILALGYRNTEKTGNPDNVKGLRFTDGSSVAAKYVPKLREKADIIVILSHEGSSIDSQIAEEVDGIDLIIGGHSHDLIKAKKIRSTYIVQALSDAAVLGEIELVVSGKKIAEIKETIHWLWHDRWSADKAVAKKIDELRKPHVSELEKKVAESNGIIGRKYKSESPFDKLVGNLLIEEYNSDVAILPGVGYGISLKPGPVTSEQIYKLLPHPSKIVTLDMTGLQLKKTLEQTAKNIKPENKEDAVGGLIQTSGIQYVLNFRNAIGRRVSDVRINNRPVDDTKLYKVVTHNGMLAGLHNYTEISKGKNIRKTDRLLTEFILENFNVKKQIEIPGNMGEVSIKK